MFMEMLLLFFNAFPDFKETSFFNEIFDENQKKNFALNHCIPIYPTPREKLELNQITFI